MTLTTPDLRGPTWRRALRSFRKKFAFWKQQQRPNPNRVILTAYEIGEREGYERAIAWAERHIPDEVSHGIHVLRANRDKTDRAMWLRHVNAYLERYDVSPITLADSPGGLIHRLRSAPRKTVNEGPLISVIMCAYNAQETIEMAARSILHQSWRPLELLIVDDNSTDDTARLAMQLAREDPRIKVHLNAANVGPYVGRNLALRHAKGEYITCHDSDDWAHPERVEKQLEFLHREQLAGALSGMLRMRIDGHFVRPSPAGKTSTDGILRLASVSALFERKAYDAHLKNWDSVRFGADSELIRRAEIAFKNRVGTNPTVSMICLEHSHSLTNDPQTGVSEKNGLSAARKFYTSNYKSWHSKLSENVTTLEFPLFERPFKASEEALVPIENILTAIENSELRVNDEIRDLASCAPE